MSQTNDFFFDKPIAEFDPYMREVLDAEVERQQRKLIMIASESLCPKPVREALGSVFTNIYAEGYPSLRMTKDEVHLMDDVKHQFAYLRRYADRRYYKGVDISDFAEALAIKRCAELFANDKVPAEGIFPNVQPLSGAAANNAVYEAFVEPNDTVMSMALSHGGHLSHGSPVNRSGKRYNIVHYHADRRTGRINFDEVMMLAEEHQPKMIIAGYSAYPWAVEWEEFRKAADLCGAILLADISHVAGLVAGGVYPSPVGYADVISFTTHKTLCGPRGAVILTTDREHAKAVDMAVFPGEQGGPHINNIAAKAVSFQLALTDEFKDLQKRIYDNAQYLVKAFQDLGLNLAYGGTDSHLLLLDLKSIPSKTGENLSGEIVSRILDMCGIVINRNTIAGDTNAVHPSAIRFGTTWVTQRGMGEKEMKKIAELVHKIISNVYSFKYQEMKDVMGRGKLPFGVMEEVRAEIEKLEAAFPREIDVEGDTGYPYYVYDMSMEKPVQPSYLMNQIKECGAKVEQRFGWDIALNYGSVEDETKAAENAIIFDDTHAKLIEVRGDIDRTRAFMQGVCTNDIATLSVGETAKTFILDDQGKVMDDVKVTRLEPLYENHDRFVVQTNTANSEIVLGWFRALADGYTVFDYEDLYAKVEGPVVVDDLQDTDEDAKRVLITMAGFNCHEVAAKIDAKLKDSTTTISCDFNGTQACVARFECHEKASQYAIMVHPDKVGDVWQTLIESGAKPAGSECKDGFRNKVNFPDYNKEERPTGTEMYEAHPHMFDLKKAHFVGQKEIIKNVKPTSVKKEFKYVPEELPLRFTALHGEHLKLTKKKNMVPFAGWEMPVWYSSITEEHEAVRKAAGLFDVAHMGVLEIAGDHAAKFIDIITANYVLWLKDGQAHYSYVLDLNGIPMDDILVYRRARDKYMVVVNAANAEKIEAWIRAVHSKEYLLDRENPLLEYEGDGIVIRNLKDPECGDDMMVDLALQGPASMEVVRRLAESPDLYRRVRNLNKFEFVEGKLADVQCIISNTGYTGEKISFELYHNPKDSVKIWDAILEAGKDLGVKPAGLGSRDSTRTEAGLPLYGHELAGDHSIQPMGAGYGAFAKLHKPFFVGRTPLIANEKERKFEIVRFQMNNKGIRAVKPGDIVFARKTNAVIGHVTSCALVNGYQLGLAYIETKYNKSGTPISIIQLPDEKRIPEGKKFNTFEIGDKTLLPENAEVLTRFPVPANTIVEKVK